MIGNAYSAIGNLEIRSLFRSLRRATTASVHSNPSTVFKAHLLLRQSFDAHAHVRDPAKLLDLVERAHNTRTFLETAAQRRGVEHSIVKNLCKMLFYWESQIERPRKKPKPEQQILRASFYDEYWETVRMCNESLKLCLPEVGLIERSLPNNRQEDQSFSDPLQ